MRLVGPAAKLGVLGCAIGLAIACGWQEGEDNNPTEAPSLATDTSTTGSATGTGTGSSGTITTPTGTQTLLPPGESCADPIGSGGGTTTVDTLDYRNDYAAYSCGGDVFDGGDGLTGNEVVLSVEVPAGQFLAAAHEADRGGILAAYLTCSPAASDSCIGAFQTPAGGAAGFSWGNDADLHQYVFLFSDGYSAGDDGPVDVLIEVYDPLIAGDSCANAIQVDPVAAAAPGGTTRVHSFAGYGNGLAHADDTCTGGDDSGADVVFEVPVESGQTVEVDLIPLHPDSDVSLYLLVGDCADPDGQCVDGANLAGPGGAEAASTVAAAQGSMFLVADSDGAGQQAFLVKVRLIGP